MKWAVATMAALAALPQLIVAQATEDPYFYVDLSEPAFDASKFRIEDEVLTVLRNGATILSRNIVISNRMRAQLLAVALTIDPEHQLAARTNELLNKKERPEPVNIIDPETKKPIDLNLIANDLLEATYAVYGASDNSTNKDALTLTAMLYDICHTLFPTNEELSYSRDIFLQNNKPAPWERVLKPAGAPAAAQSPAMRLAAVRGVKLARTTTGVTALVNTQSDAAAMAMRVKHLENVTDETAVRRMRFDGDVEKPMADPLPAIAELMEQRHGDWVKEGLIEFAFIDRSPLNDEETAMLACAVMVEGLISSDGIDEAFACAGSLTAEGAVLATSAPLAKLRAAELSGTRIVALPSVNRAALTDLALLGKAVALTKMQVFLVSKFDDTWAVARSERSPEIQASMGDFARLQARFEKDGVTATIRSESSQQLLRQILMRTPNHGSAMLLLAAAENRLPTKLSFDGSVEELIARHAILQAQIDPVTETPLPTSDLVFFQNELVGLKQIIPKIGEKAKPLGTALLEFAEALEGQKRAGGTDANSPLRRSAEAASKTIRAELEKMSQ